MVGFYTWYMDYASGPDRKNPLVDGAYRDREELAPELVQEVDLLLKDAQGPHVDPFLMAQDVPNMIKIDDVVVAGNQATVYLSTNLTSHELAVDLAQRGGAWLICSVSQPSVSPGANDHMSSSALEKAVVATTAFYDWYLDYVRSGEEGPRSLLSDGAFTTCEYLSDAYIEQLAGQLAAGEGLHADPFLCAQDIPDSVQVVEATHAGPGVQVKMASSFEGHTFDVFLRETEPGLWQIDGIVPARE